MERMAAGSAALIEGPMFAHRFLAPADPSGDCLFLLHGSGVDETTLMPLGQRIDQRASLVAARGRIPQEGGGMRWFTRITPTRFEQNSIRREADAFARFVKDAAVLHRIDLSRTTFLGYSNGANLISSVMLLHPGLIPRAVLLRPMPVLDGVPSTDLSGTRVLIIAGARDETYGPYAPALLTLLDSHGAEVDARIVAAGHEFGDADVAITKRWLRDGGPAQA